MATVTEMPPSETLQTPFDPTENEPIAQTSTSPAAPASTNKKLPRGRPPKGTQVPPDGRALSFFDRVASVPREDWGAKAFMYVYADEPICNAKTLGEKRYLLKSSEAILDLERLKQDYGSFKGWMTLNLRKSGKDQTDETDRLSFEIYDPKSPPKIPKSSWANDSRNKRWADLLPPDPPPANAAAASLLDSIKVYKEIRDEVKDEMEPDAEPKNRTRDTLETMRLAKDLFATPAAAPAAAPIDPFSIASQIMAMRANDPMVAILSARLDSMDKALTEARTREFELQKQILERAGTPTAQPKSMVEQLLELATAADKLEPVKKLFAGVFGGATEAVTRSTRTGAYDAIRDVLSSPFGERLGQGLGVMLSNFAAPANGAPGAPTTALNPAANGAPRPQETEAQRMERIAQTITGPMLYEYFLKDRPGDEFAEWMFDGWADDYAFVRKFGPEKIVGLYRSFAPAWSVIAPKAEGFAEFIKEFCEWKPEGDDEPITTTATAAPADGVEDLEGQS